MPTSFTFTGSSAGYPPIFGPSSGGTTKADGSTPGTITAQVDDGVISVGDAVNVTGFISNTTSTNTGGVDGVTAYYLGTQTFAGTLGYVFAADPVVTNNTNFFIAHSTIIPTGFPTLQTSSAARDFAANPGGFTLGTQPACFVSGTMIETGAGPQAVEALSIGDPVLTADGRQVPVRWIGRQTVLPMFASADMAIVQIAAGALGPGVPSADLRLTADHGLMVDGVLVNAGALVGLDGVTFVAANDLPDQITVYHIETEAHDVILANGAPSETFIDYAGRQAFDNYAEYVELYGAERIISEMAQPRISTARMLPAAIKTRPSTEAQAPGVTRAMVA